MNSNSENSLLLRLVPKTVIKSTTLTTILRHILFMEPLRLVPQPKGLGVFPLYWILTTLEQLYVEVFILVQQYELRQIDL